MHAYDFDTAAEYRLVEYLNSIGCLLGNVCQRASFATYTLGLLGDGERKSVEPIAARACGDASAADPAHQRLLYFVGRADWSDRDVRRAAARYALDRLVAREPVASWIVDDTGFLKQGSHSVGVQRQYTGSAGKVTNCQIGVSLSLATRSEHVPVDFELYLPQSWTDDPARRREGKIPDDVVFKPKWQLALDMIERGVKDGLPLGVLLADSDYGDRKEFRHGVRWLGLDYAVGVHAPTTVWRLDALHRRIGKRVSVGDLGRAIGRRGFRQTTWRDGSGKLLASRFAMQRVLLPGVKGAKCEEVWLLIEWPEGEPEPTKFFVATLPRRTTRKKLVRLVKERWRTERVYEDLKGELGLDHFEGRSFRGWHHHVTSALCCFAFVVAERTSAFPPSAGWSCDAHADDGTPGAPLRRLVHHHPAGDRAHPGDLAAPLPSMPPATRAGETAWCTCS